MRRAALLSATLSVIAFAAYAGNPPGSEARAAAYRSAGPRTEIFYRVRIDTADCTAIGVEMLVQNAPDTFRIAMAAHPEYDDRYWRFVEGLQVEGDREGTGVTRLDSALWFVRAPGGAARLRYRIRLPAPQQPRRAAWRPFVSPGGGLIGGPHTFMYLVGAPLAPSHVRLDIPAGWEAITGLEATEDPRTFIAPGAAPLVDSPFLVGHVNVWRFSVNGVPHRIAYLPLPGSVPIDTAGITGGIASLAREAGKLFGGFPYHDYTYVLEDGAYGALEHLNSVTVGFSSGEIRRDPRSLFATLAHEYFHTWNLMRLRPPGFGELRYTPAPRSRGLWWSEGVTMLYAYILLRRAGLPVYDSSRVTHCAKLISAYKGSPGNSHFSPEEVSLYSFAPTPGGLGDYSASTHLQGELIGTMIDLIIRDATDGRRSMDDLMTMMFKRYSGERGFTVDDVENAVTEICGCPVRSFFDTSVRGAGGIDFNRYLGLLGLRMRVERVIPRDSGGAPSPDLRAYAWETPGEGPPALGITDPASCWGRAGLHTGDLLAGVNGSPVTAAGFRTLLRGLRTGDTLALDLRRRGSPLRANVIVTGYDRPDVTIEELPGGTEKQRKMLRQWESCMP